MSTANPRQHDAWLPIDLESVTWVVRDPCRAVRARLADADALAEATTDPFVDRRVVIDRASTCAGPSWSRRNRHAALLAVRARPIPGGGLQDGHGQGGLGALEAVPPARTTRAVLAAALDTSAGAVRPLAEALVGQADIGEVAERSVATCRRFLVLADWLVTTVDTTWERE